MNCQNACNAYRQTQVQTASGGQLVVMLYDAAIKNLSGALSIMRQDGGVLCGDVEKFNERVTKAQKIITELSASLDMSAGGEISKNLLNLYLFFNQLLLEGNIHRDRAKIENVKEMMSQLRETWATLTGREPAMQKRAEAFVGV